jgi:hypothetical protein|tara:strand:- start:187 stop:591 length:405 start_codon:yes stop_codon:yes gene_type:complete
MFKKILSIIFGIVLLMSMAPALAGHEEGGELPKDYEPAPNVGPNLYWLQMPVICGSSEDVIAYIQKRKFALVNVSFGKEKAHPDGKPVFIVQYYVDPTYTQSLVVMTTLNGVESCMLYKSFDLKFANPKKGIGS